MRPLSHSDNELYKLTFNIAASNFSKIYNMFCIYQNQPMWKKKINSQVFYVLVQNYIISIGLHYIDDCK